MNLLSLWFQHPSGDLCWRRVLTVALNVSMLAWVGSAIAGLIDGAPYWFVWWAIAALSVVAGGCPHHSQVSAESKDLCAGER